MAPPSSLHAHKARQTERLYGAVANVWNRHQGDYQADIVALLALVDDGQLTIRDAHERLVDLEHRTRTLNIAA